ncbi:microtubule-associated protein 9 isoform X1 [Melanerpes formicivorus]|uniref:microtubule-associated protein 9 isoform X1 n=1 Tax=Melanerpes formicivorus TaxID=211600 RepID=UPI00358F0160
MSGEGAGRRTGMRRSAVQDELQEANTAHEAKEQTAEYSDDFESDEDGTLNGAGEELNEHSSGAESSKESVAIESPLSDDDSSQKAGLEKEAADDLALSFSKEKLQQIVLSESEKIEDDREHDEECLESQNQSDDRRNNDECSAVEVPCDNGESDHCTDLPFHELQKKNNQEEHKPIPKPRLHKTRSASASDQDQSKISTGDLKLEGNSRKSPSVTEVVTTPKHENTKKLEMPTEENSVETLKIVEGQTVTDTIQEVSVSDQSEHGEAETTSEDSVKKLSETKERVLQNPNASLSGRSLSSASLKRKAKAVPSAAPVSSQYLGTLKVLEDKCLQNSTELSKADSLRAAVFQNWLEKKRALLLELKRIEKKKAENLRNDTEKKEAVKREEAIASFEAWKKKKGKEAKKLSEQKKLEELKKKKAAEQNEEKTEAAQKAFEKWKERKVEYLRAQNRKEKESERIKKKKEEELIAEKRRDSMSAVEKWNEKKEEYTKQKKAEKVLERRKQKIQQAKKEEKDKRAMEEYEKWLEKKERREELEKKQKKLQAAHGIEVPPPWSPPGKVTYSRNY